MESFSVKLKRAQLSEEVGEDGPALETVLEGPLLSAKRKRNLKHVVDISPAQSLSKPKLLQSQKFYKQWVRVTYMPCTLVGACSCC